MRDIKSIQSVNSESKKSEWTTGRDTGRDNSKIQAGKEEKKENWTDGKK